MPSNPKIDDVLATCAAACARLERHVAELARAKGIKVTIELELERGAGIHRVRLCHGRREFVVTIDEDVFEGADVFFDALVLPQIDGAIGKLATLN